MREVDARLQREECDARARARRMAEFVAWYPGYRQRCCIGGEPVFFEPANEPYVPGHIYSEDGVNEFGITRMCEFHFDYATLDMENEVEDDTIWA